MEAEMENLLKSLDGFTKGLENMVSDSIKNMPPDQAIQFAKAMQSEGVQAKMQEAQDAVNELKRTFKP